MDKNNKQTNKQTKKKITSKSDNTYFQHGPKVFKKHSKSRMKPNQPKYLCIMYEKCLWITVFQ